MRMLFNSGFGDWLQVESRLKDITAIVWLDPADRVRFGDVIGAMCPEVGQEDYPAPHDCDVFTYHAVLPRFPYLGSSALTHALADVSRFDLPRDFVVIQPDTPKTADRSRAFSPEDWGAAIARLDRLDMGGVVLNSQGGQPVPKHRRIMDLTGRTSICESVEILKRAQGFIGVDSWIASLSAQLFPPACLAIKSSNPYLIANPEIYFAPLTSIGFVYPRLDLDPYPDRMVEPIHKNMTRLKLLKETLVGLRVHPAGALIEIDDQRAKYLVENKAAVLYFEPLKPTPKTVEKAVMSPTVEKAITHA